jgi:ABC-type sugar transport system substrate-binding protein
VRLSSVALVLTLPVAFALFASASLGAPKSVRIAYFQFAAANTYTEASMKGALLAAKKAGNVTIDKFDGQANAEKQAKDMQDALASGDYDGWMVYQIGPAAWRFSEQAIAKGVKVVGILVPFGPSPEKTGPVLEGQLAATFLDHKQLRARSSTSTATSRSRSHP